MNETAFGRAREPLNNIFCLLSSAFCAGSGSVHMPLKTFFLPQKPYMPIGTLRHQLLFPSGAFLQGSCDRGKDCCEPRTGRKGIVKNPTSKAVHAHWHPMTSAAVPLRCLASLSRFSTLCSNSVFFQIYYQKRTHCCMLCIVPLFCLWCMHAVHASWEVLCVLKYNIMCCLRNACVQQRT